MSPRKRNEDQLRRLTAVVQALRGLDSVKAKGKYLYKKLKEDPYLVKYLRLTYDPELNFPFTSEDVPRLRDKIEYPKDFTMPLFLAEMRRFGKGKFLKRDAVQGFIFLVQYMPKELRQTALAIVDRDLKCDLPLWVVNKVFAKLEIEQIPVISQQREARPRRRKENSAEAAMAVEVYLSSNEYAFGDVLWQGAKVGTITFVIGHGMRSLIAELRKAGVAVMSRPSDPTAAPVEL